MIRGAFDTDKLAFTELLGVPNGIRGCTLNVCEDPVSFVPGILLEIDSFSGVYFFNESRFQKKVFTRAECLILNLNSYFILV